MERHKMMNREESHRAEQPGASPTTALRGPLAGDEVRTAALGCPRAFSWGLCVLKSWSAATGRGIPGFCSGLVWTTGLVCPAGHAAPPCPRRSSPLWLKSSDGHPRKGRVGLFLAQLSRIKERHYFETEHKTSVLLHVSKNKNQKN